MTIKVRARGQHKAEVLIYEHIGKDFWDGSGVTAKQFVEDLKALGEVDQITVRINSPGGAVADGIAIYNALKSHRAKVAVQIDAAAYSIASIIAMAGDTISMAANAMMMIHDPFMLAVGNADDMRRAAAILDINAEVLAATYGARTGKPADEVRELMKAETWMTAEQAVAMGFADEALEALPMAANFDLSRFRNVPAAVLAQSVSSDVPKVPQEEQMTTPATSATPADITAAQIQARKDALQAESTRRDQIKALFKGHAQQHELLAACLDDMDCTAEVAGRKLLALLAEGTTPTANGTPRVNAGADARDNFVAGMTNAILARHNVEKIEAGNQFAGVSLSTVVRDCLARAGVAGAQRMERHALAGAIFAAHSTSDFPLLLANTANKALRKAYDTAPQTWSMWCGTSSVPDFKSNSRIQLGTFNSLATIPEGGEFTGGSFSEEAETITAATKGRFLSMTRQMVINDDLGVFVRRASMLGFAAARTVNEDVYAKLAANPTMSDTGALFNATAVTTAGGHANLTGTGTAITVASIAIGEGMMALQKDKDLRTTLNILPKFILVPRAKKQVAWDVLNSPTDISQANSAKRNYAASLGLDIVTDAELDKASGTAWYLATDPNLVPLIEVAFLDGNQTPFTDEHVDFMTDALLLKVRLDYGVAAIDWRAGYKNNGA